jgi:hypothetical protein
MVMYGGMERAYDLGGGAGGGFDERAEVVVGTDETRLGVENGKVGPEHGVDVRLAIPLEQGRLLLKSAAGAVGVVTGLSHVDDEERLV